MAREYHGYYGEIAAIRKGAAGEPLIKEGRYFPSFTLPDTAVPPPDALYHDGSPHGYPEALVTGIVSAFML